MQSNSTYKSYRQILLEKQGKGLPEYEVTELLKQVLPQLAALHTQGLAHGAISLDTLVLHQADRLSMLLEVPSNQFDLSKDVLDLGVSIAQLLTAQPPELLVDPYGKWQWEEFVVVSDQFGEFLNHTLSNDFGTRYANANEMLPVLGITSENYPLPTSINYSSNYSLSPEIDPPTKTSQLTPWQWTGIGIGAGLLLLLASFGVSKLSSPQQQLIGESPNSNGTSTPTPIPTVTVTATPTPTSTFTGTTTQNSPPSGSENLFENAIFPQNECGDPLPTDPNAYPVNLYPVFIDFSDRNLQIARSQYCQDSIEKPRKGSGKVSVQVASFVTLEKANAFRDFLSKRIGQAEVGEPSVITRDRSPALPSEVQVPQINFFSQPNRARQSEAKTYVGTLNRGQQAHFTEKNRFAPKIEELGIGINTYTDNYSYGVIVLDPKRSTQTIGIARRDGLKSYTGGVFLALVAKTNDVTSLAILCESNQPSTAMPPSPKISGNYDSASGLYITNSNFQIICPNGYTQVGN